MTYQLLPTTGAPIMAWINGVPVENEVISQLQDVAKLPFVYPHLAVMPDTHWGNGAAIGSVIPMRGAVVPAAVGVDIGCSISAIKLNLTAGDLPVNLEELRNNIERAVPHGRTNNGKVGVDRGSWGNPPEVVLNAFSELEIDLRVICAKNTKINEQQSLQQAVHQLGTLGTGNHFIELCLDESNDVWVLIHSGSRGVGNRIGNVYINAAREACEKNGFILPNTNLGFLEETNPLFEEYVDAVQWAQTYAKANHTAMRRLILETIRNIIPKMITKSSIYCSHNYLRREYHGEWVWVTRKGAVSALKDELVVIPGSMGAKSYIARGLGNVDSLCSCSHGAGRAMSRNEAKRRFTIDDHTKATIGVECRKDKSVLDETPGAYKDIDAVMAAQSDLVEVVHTLKQVLCVKG